MTIVQPTAGVSRRRFNLAVTAAASAVCLPVLAQNTWPNKPIRIIVPYTPGGFTDQMARIVQVGLQNRLQQTDRKSTRLNSSHVD